MGRPWVPEELDELKEYAAKGHSASQIASLMNRSRNQVIGQCNRRGFKLGISQGKRTPPPVDDATAAKAKEALANRKSVTVAKPNIQQLPKSGGTGLQRYFTDFRTPKTMSTVSNMEPVGGHREEGYKPAETFESVHIDEARSNQCRFPLWEGADRTGLVCGQVTVKNSSWCEKCHKLVFPPRKDPRLERMPVR